MNANPRPAILYATATAVEARALLQRLGVEPPYPTGRPIVRREVSVLIAGVGAAGAGPLEKALRRSTPAAVVNLGIAGALAPDLDAGEIVVVRRWVGPGSTERPAGDADHRLVRDLGGRLEAGGLFPTIGDAVTVNVPLHDPARRDELHDATGASIVEMEGAMWRRRAADLGVPFAAIRIVSDHADRRLPDYRDWLLSPDGEPRWGRFLMALLRSGAWRRPLRETRKILAAGDAWRAAMAALDAVSAALLEGGPVNDGG